MVNGIFLTTEDIKKVMACGSTKACSISKRVNEYTLKQKPGTLLPGRGRCYLKGFSEITGIPRAEVLEALNG